MRKPKKLTLAQVAASLRGAKLRAWEAATQAERRQVTDMLNEEAARKHAEAVRTAALKKQQVFVDRFMDRFWAPVLKEQAAAKKAAKKKR